MYYMALEMESKRRTAFLKSVERAHVHGDALTMVRSIDLSERTLRNKRHFRQTLEVMSPTIYPGKKIGISPFGKHHFEHPGHAGCALTHWHVLHQITQQKEPYAVILESDVKLYPTFASELQQHIQTAPPDWDLIFLFRSHETPEDSKVSNHASFIRSGPITTTMAYMVTKRGAQKLLDRRNMDGSLYPQSLICITTWLSSAYLSDISSVRSARDADDTGSNICRQWFRMADLHVYALAQNMPLGDAFIEAESYTDGVFAGSWTM